MRLLVHVEGETEKAFIDGILAPHLGRHGYASISARLIGGRRSRASRGGGMSWPSVRRGIVQHLKEDERAFVTTMVDYYGMPQSKSTQWPGRVAANSLPLPQRAGAVQNAIGADITKRMGEEFDTRRFIPYVSMHEFEALLFADCGQFAIVVGRPDLADATPPSRSAEHWPVVRPAWYERHLTLRLHFLKRFKNSTMQWARCKTLRPLNHQTADQFCSDRSLLSSRVLIVSEETLKWLAASWQRSSERSFPRKSRTAS